MANRYWANAALKKYYGITLEDKEAMESSQCGQCAICEKTAKLEVDHDHKTGKVRALLCKHCNRLLGSCNDNTDILFRAVEYLQKFQ